MKRKLLWLAGTVALVVVLAVAFIIYENAGIKPENTLVSPEQRTASPDRDLAPEDRESADSSGVDTGTEEPAPVLAPDFSVTDMDGNTVKLSDLRGKPVILNFWASWCPPCKGEMPDFQAAFEEHGDDIHFMMVDLVDGQQEKRSDGEGYIAEQGYTFPVYFDEAQEAAYAYGITSIPTSIFIDEEGYVVAGLRGAIDEDVLAQGIDLLVG